MAQSVYSFTVVGIDGRVVRIETELLHGISGVSIIGLGDQAIKEAKERIEAAIINSGFDFPQYKVIINLAPGDMKKSGSSFDLGMAIGLLLASNQLVNAARDLTTLGFIGELSLDGRIRPSRGVLPMVIKAKEEGFKSVILARENVLEARLIEGIEIVGMDTFKNCVAYLKGKETVVQPVVTKSREAPTRSQPDFHDVKGQKELIQYIQIAVAGGHNILMVGSPGCGKSMIAKRIPSILPKMSRDEALEVTKIYSVTGGVTKGQIIESRPFRAPHHNASTNALVGGGRLAMPGEITLAHNGVLFLDEIPQFEKRALEALRQPMEDGQVAVTRVEQTNTYPSKFMLVAAMNPCPCGYYGQDRCQCTDKEILKYRQKVSGPIMDRIDIQKYVTPIDFLKEYEDEDRIESETLREAVERIRAIQENRFSGEEGIHNNAQMEGPLIEKYCVLDEESKLLMKQAFQAFHFSARSYSKYLKIARTFADYHGHENILKSDLIMALSSRDLEKEERDLLK